MLSKLSLVASLASVLFIAGAHGAQCNATSLSRANFWFVFGGSYTTVGFNANGTLPAPGNPLGNPAFPGKTVTGGTNYVDVLTTELNRSLTLTYDYAVSGATVDESIVKLGTGSRSLKVQIGDFLQGAGQKPKSAPWTRESALFSIFIGINDVLASYRNGGDRDAFNDVLMDAYFGQVQRLVSRLASDAGARNFLFIDVPPVERAPASLNNNATDRLLEKNTIIDYNSKLADRAKAFQAKYWGVKTWVWDSNGAINNILDNYEKYGFTNITSWGGPGDFWGNNYHPSSTAQTIMAKDIAAVVNGTRWFS
ncbi:fungal cellulose binding domain-containing protein [Ganoderma leucocontextum]|nr:fungal cellulose binding domain-containing protein [Ganoderma leucocontextum]